MDQDSTIYDDALLNQQARLGNIEAASKRLDYVVLSRESCGVDKEKTARLTAELREEQGFSNAHEQEVVRRRAAAQQVMEAKAALDRKYERFMSLVNIDPSTWTDDDLDFHREVLAMEPSLHDQRNNAPGVLREACAATEQARSTKNTTDKRIKELRAQLSELSSDSEMKVYLNPDTRVKTFYRSSSEIVRDIIGQVRDLSTTSYTRINNLLKELHKAYEQEKQNSAIMAEYGNDITVADALVEHIRTVIADEGGAAMTYRILRTLVVLCPTNAEKVKLVNSLNSAKAEKRNPHHELMISPWNQAGKKKKGHKNADSKSTTAVVTAESSTPGGESKSKKKRNKKKKAAAETVESPPEAKKPKATET